MKSASVSTQSSSSRGRGQGRGQFSAATLQQRLAQNLPANNQNKAHNLAQIWENHPAYGNNNVNAKSRAIVRRVKSVKPKTHTRNIGEKVRNFENLQAANAREYLFVDVLQATVQSNAAGGPPSRNSRNDLINECTTVIGRRESSTQNNSLPDQLSRLSHEMEQLVASNGPPRLVRMCEVFALAAEAVERCDREKIGNRPRTNVNVPSGSQNTGSQNALNTNIDSCRKYALGVIDSTIDVILHHAQLQPTDVAGTVLKQDMAAKYSHVCTNVADACQAHLNQLTGGGISQRSH